jgi:hypothetical protein
VAQRGSQGPTLAEKIDESASFEQGGAALQRVQRLYFDGDMDANVANTGQVAGRIEDIPPAADIIKQMWPGAARCWPQQRIDSGLARTAPDLELDPFTA